MTVLSARDPGLAERHRFRAAEALPWLCAIAWFFLLPDYLTLGYQILIWIIFALSLDLILGYTGIVTLGHAAFFGTGAYTAGLMSVHLHWNEPITELIAAMAVAALVGFVSGWMVLRTKSLTLVMLTLATTILLQETGNYFGHFTGGADGLRDVHIDPIFGLFKFDLWGQVGYIYCLVVLAILFVVTRALVHSPFGQSLRGIRENQLRMPAIGAPVPRELLTVYTISAAMAGAAGALLTQTSEFTALETFSFGRSGDVLVILILGGTGRLYGAFIGAFIYVILQDQLAKLSPTYWLFGIGLVLVLTIVFAPRGLLGLMEDAARKLGWWR